jgi:iron(III) transport system permease protein
MRQRGQIGLLTFGRLWGLLASAAILYFLVWPLAMLVVSAIRTSPYGTKGRWTLDGFATVLSDSWIAPTLTSTVFYAAVSTVGCMLLGFYFATVTTRMATPLRWLVTPAMVILIATPRLFYALSWGMLGNPNSGLVARALHGIGVQQIPDWMTVYSWQGLLLVTALKLTGFAYLMLYGPVSRADRSFEDAAVISGVARPRAFIDITLTSLTPALLAASMLIFVDVLQVFDLPAVLGMPAGIHTLPIRVNDYLLESAEPNWAAASALSLVIVIVVAILLLVQRAIMRDNDYITIGGKSNFASVAPIGKWRWAVDASILGFITIAILLPILQIALGSFQPFFGLYGVWTLDNYRNSLSDAIVVKTLRDTLAITVFGGLFTVAGAFGMAYVMQRRPGTVLAHLSRIGSWVPAVAPGIVLSLALLWSYLNTPLVKQLYGTPWLLLFALIVGSIPVAVRTLEGIVAQVGPEVEEAARVCGAGYYLAICETTARLSLPSLVAAWFLVGLAISGTLDIPLLLQSANSQTVATLTYARYTYGQVSQAAAIYCLYLILAFGAVGVAVAIGAAVRTLRHSLTHTRRAEPLVVNGSVDAIR